MPRDLFEEYGIVKADLFPERKKVEPTSAIGAFTRSAINAIPMALHNVFEKIGLPVVPYEEAAPPFFRPQPGDEAHPIAQFAGGMTGFAPLGIGTGALARSTIPAWGRVAQSAAPSLIKRSAVYGTEGAGIGGLYAPKGQEVDAALSTGLLAAALGGAGVSLAQEMPRLIEARRGRGNLDRLAKATEKSESRAALSAQEVEALKKELTTKYGTTSPERLQRAINEKTQRIQELRPTAELPFERTSNLLPGATGEDILKLPQKNIEQTAAKIDAYLRKGAPHDEEVALATLNKIENTKKGIQQNYYEKAKSDLLEKNVVIPRTADVEKLTNSLKKVTSQDYWNTPQFNEMLNQLKLQESYGNDIIPANDFVDMWKSTKNAARVAKANMRAIGETPEKRAFWEKEYKRLEPLATKQWEILKNNIGEDTANLIKQGDNLWKEKIVPLYENKTYWQIKDKGRIDSANIMKELRGTGKGQEILRNVIMEDPEITKNVVAHRYAGNPEKLLSHNETEARYINVLPELKSFIEELRQAKASKPIADQRAAELQAESRRVQKAFEETATRQKARANAIKETERLTKELKSQERDINRIQEALKRAEKNSRRAKELKDKLENAQKKRRKIINLLRNIAISGGSAALGVKIYDHF